MTAAYEQTATYAQQRIQFGKPLTTFQVVQHRLAEMAVGCVEAMAACELASLLIGGGDEAVASVASMARSKVGREARLVAQAAVQLHGAMGVTEELPIASHFRKLMAFSQEAGSTASHSNYLGEAMLRTGAWRHSRTLGYSTDVER